MLVRTKTNSSLLELDKAFQYAVTDEPVEAPAKTYAENYFELRYAWPE